MSKVFGKITQLGYIVKDMDESIEYFTKTLGIGPFFLLKDVRFDDFRYLGEASEAPLLTIALGNSDDMQIELIQQHDDNPSIYKDTIDAGNEGFQHLSTWCTTAEMAPIKARLKDKGYTVIQEGSYKAMGGLFVYYDTGSGPGRTIMEIANMNEPTLAGLGAAIREAAANWDGVTPTFEM